MVRYGFRNSCFIGIGFGRQSALPSKSLQRTPKPLRGFVAAEIERRAAYVFD